jgi:hypothetical protein
MKSKHRRVGAAGRRKPALRASKSLRRAPKAARRRSKSGRRRLKSARVTAKSARRRPKSARRAPKFVHPVAKAAQKGSQPKRRLGPDRAPVGAVQPSEAEQRLLTLASEVTTLSKADRPVAATLRLLASAYAPGAALPRAVARAWLAARGDKTMTLALAWARENVRLVLEEVLERSPHGGTLPGGADTRAWLLLAACEAIAYEPPAAGADRLRALLELTGQEADPI